MSALFPIPQAPAPAHPDEASSDPDRTDGESGGRPYEAYQIGQSHEDSPRTNAHSTAHCSGSELVGAANG